MTELCSVCENINFAAILTPRERNRSTGEWAAIFRPEWTGNGKDPCLGWPDSDEEKADRPRRRRRPPHIRNAVYDELSDATRSDDDESEVVIEPEAPEANPDLLESLVADMSGLQDSDSNDGQEDHAYSYKAESQTSSSQGLVDLAEVPDPRNDSAGSARNSSANLESGSETEVTLSNTDPHRQHDAGTPTRYSQTESHSDSRSLYGSDVGGDNNDSHDSEPESTRSLSTSSFTWSPDSRFSRGDKIDVEKQAQGSWNYRHGQFYSLGSIWDVRSRRYECDLCWKFWQRMRNDWAVKNTYLLRSRVVLKLLELKGKGREDDPKREVIMLNLLFAFGYETRLGWEIRTSYVFHGAHTGGPNPDQHIEARPNGTYSWCDDMFGEARTMNNICDFSLFRQWLACCEQEHRHEEPQTTTELCIRLIDVRQQCLVEWTGNTVDVPRFVALSYVWGVTPQKLLLTKSNRTEMMKPGAFRLHDLSKTIEDAIDLVSHIGENYLWIDALCILQDSPEDQAVQIPQMHDIYSKSVLTIVAAIGQDADAGLQGVREGSRGKPIFRLDLDDICVTIRPAIRLWPTPHNIGFKENYLSGWEYLSRAWTLQEALLSRRTLIFAKDQVYWECATDTWNESTHWESSSLRFVTQRAIKNPTPEDVWKDNFDRRAYDTVASEEEATYEVKPDSYECLVREYTGRKLTYDSDILKAFTGIMPLIERREQTTFLFALRKRHFGNDLLFNITTAVPRRVINGGAEIPSWSWLGWKGTAEFANEVRNSSSDLVENLIPCDGMRCYVLEIDSDNHKSLRVINETGGWQFYQTYVRTGEGIFDPTAFYLVDRTRDANDAYELYDEIHHGHGATGKVIDWAGAIIGADQIDDSPAIQGERSCPDIPVEATDEAQNEESSAGNSELQECSGTQDEIPEYVQTLTITDLQSHAAFSSIRPDFHIMFCTFSSTVELCTEEDEFVKLMSRSTMAGTKLHRRNGINSNQDIIQRKLFLCTRDRSRGPSVQRRYAEDRLSAALKLRQVHRDRGTYFGHLPEPSKSWDSQEYMRAIPDGVYTVLWMNNNQLPMHGHILCRPATSGNGEGLEEGDVSGILERICGVTGPTEILTKKAQEKWKARWGTFVLG